MPLLSIAENIFLGNEQAKYGVIDWSAVTLRTRDLLRMVGLSESPTTLITDIGVGKQQLVEIAKALSKEVKLLILDEPTASLNESDSDALLDLLLEFKSAGHLLDPDLPQAQRDLRSRRLASPSSATAARSRPWIAGSEAVSEDRIIRGMVGRRWPTAIPKRDAQDRRDAVRGEGLERPSSGPCRPASIKNVSMNVRRGEIVGIAGLMGAGRTEFAMSVFGRSYGQADHRQGVCCTARRSTSARSGRRWTAASPTSPRTASITAWCSNDNIMHNISLANLPGVSQRVRARRHGGTRCRQ